MADKGKEKGTIWGNVRKCYGSPLPVLVTSVRCLFTAPAKPEKPTVVVTGEPAAFNVTYNFGVGGGWTHEFKVLYKKKGENNNNNSNDNNDNDNDNSNDSTILLTKETFPIGSC